MNYLVIDLEMCRVQKMYRKGIYRRATEIIQIGSVLLGEDYQVIRTLCQYVRPEYGVIDHFIQNFTGINNSNTKKAPVLKEALAELIDWIGDEEYKILAWSSSDFNQMQYEVTTKMIGTPEIMEFMLPERWIDYQEVFGKRYDFEKSVSLEEALVVCDIEPDGRFHDGLCDAINTAKLIEKLENDPDFDIHRYEKNLEEEADLSFSMGSLFAGLKLDGK